tara:strand:+ start:404 stop:1177 length:774 start_codon:yes stop_codon:yes gene_type:complete
MFNLNITEMGNNKKKKGRKVVSANGKPFVSICTPTYNRRHFIPQLIKCFKNQNYPKQLMEWIIVDDGEDSVEDLFKDVECVKYFRVEEKMKLGRKRNFMHEKTKGEIIVYMDDDDYYPPDRVNHAVNRLRAVPRAMAAGSSIVYIYFNDLDKIYQFGPYGPMHATAGTFAFKRELLKETRYDDNAELAEEKHFLKNYTVPLVQLDPMKAILVFAHQYNTFDKRRLLVNPHPNFVRETKLKPKLFIRDKEMRDFYISA